MSRPLIMLPSASRPEVMPGIRSGSLRSVFRLRVKGPRVAGSARILSLLLPAPAPSVEQEPALPFRVGVRLTFQISWFGIPAGESEIAAAGRATYIGAPVLRLISTVRSKQDLLAFLSRGRPVREPLGPRRAPPSLLLPPAARGILPDPEADRPRPGEQIRLLSTEQRPRLGLCHPLRCAGCPLQLLPPPLDEARFRPDAERGDDYRPREGRVDRPAGIAEDSLLARAIRRARAGKAPHERTAGRQPLKIDSPKLWINGAGIARIPDNQGAAPNAAHRAI